MEKNKKCSHPLSKPLERNKMSLVYYLTYLHVDALLHHHNGNIMPFVAFIYLTFQNTHFTRTHACTHRNTHRHTTLSLGKSHSIGCESCWDLLFSLWDFSLFPLDLNSQSAQETCGTQTYKLPGSCYRDVHTKDFCCRLAKFGFQNSTFTLYLNVQSGRG